MHVTSHILRAGAALAAAGVVLLATTAVQAEDAGPSGEAVEAGTDTGETGVASMPTEEASPTVATALPGQDTWLPEVVVRGRAEDILGIALSASEGAIGVEDLKDLPLLRRGEIMETVPGLVVTQHSGDGKANQYFLRGFNLDHGTDFAFSVDDVPVNLPSHAHGQGYADLNFMIPELIDSIEYKKGPFYAEVGDFSGAGAANVHLVDTLPTGILNLQGGAYGFARGLAAASPKLGPGTLLYALEYNHYDGPWVVHEDSNRFCGLLRYHVGLTKDELSLTASVYAAPDWHATDHVAERAVNQDLITRFGTLDASDGGSTGRGALSFNWRHSHDDGTTALTVYGFYYRLDLYSNFTYFLDDPVNGDQFEQIDRRYVAGVDLKRTWNQTWFGKEVENTIGLQLRNDYLPWSGLDHTRARQVIGVLIDDRIEELTGGAYLHNQVQWMGKLRTHLSVRADVFALDVHSNDPANSDRASSGIISPKASIIAGPWRKTELYLSLGTGFHSNDARGVTATVGATDLAPQTGVPLLVRTEGAEIGARTSILPGLVSTLSLWYLRSDSELTFSGDAGDTEATSASRRYGVEWANFYKPLPWLTLAADVALTHARYLHEPAGPYIPNSIPMVVSGVVTLAAPSGLFASARVRALGTQPLAEDNSVRQPALTMVDARVGYRFDAPGGRYEVALDGLNLLDSKGEDIAYAYVSRLPGEAAGVNDVHFHPVEPFEIRAGVTLHY